MRILGIETSCDETAVAIVDDQKNLLANLVLSQMKEHEDFGGVVPEIAARSHIDHLHDLITKAMTKVGLRYGDLDGVAATSGPGLIGGVMVGMVAGKAIAAAHDLPFLAINHLEGHALTARLVDDVPFPFLLLLVSGGHTQILLAEDVDCYQLWGTTIDDAAGECFDKAAKLMGLGYPGGPAVQAVAAECANHKAAIERFPLPRPLVGKNKKDIDMLDFSFSGLKTAVRTHVDALPAGDLQRTDIAALAYAFQEAMADIVYMRCEKALERFTRLYPDTPKQLVIAGGVAANSAIRARLDTLDARMIAPPLALCSDNAAMIAWAGVERLQRGLTDGLDFKARPRWPLDKKAV
jgi:N6-L-threonylcarbamoyladenine synthase